MIEDLLTLTRAGGTVEELEWVNLRTLVEGCWANVDTASAELEVTTDLAVFANESRLRHVFENLFRNAVQHTGDRVTVRVGQITGGTGFYVSDDGPGIPEEERSEVFGQGYTTAETGTGFGLNIVQEIVEAHGWEIDVTASSDGGARFDITGADTRV
jgi:signal transduction histidine kinase